MPFDCVERDDDGSDDDRWRTLVALMVADPKFRQLVFQMLDDPRFRQQLAGALCALVEPQLNDDDGPTEVIALTRAMIRSPAGNAVLLAAGAEYRRQHWGGP